jgi:enoyl-CoA hydratase
MGLLNRVMAAETFEQEVASFALSLANGPRQAIALSKRAVFEGLGGSLEDGLAVERQAFTEVFTTRDAAIGVESFQTEGPGKARFGRG